MSQHAERSSKYQSKLEDDLSIFTLKDKSQLKGILGFLFQDWWKVQISGLELLPHDSPALIVGNSGSVLPWPALMLLYALATSKDNPKPLKILVEMDWINCESLQSELIKLGFLPWSADNAKHCLALGYTVCVFPEGKSGFAKPFAERNRTSSFDWTRLLPAVEMNVPIFPLATLGCDEAIPVFANLKGLAHFAKLPSYPITPFFPWLPFPFNLLSFPIKWQMRLIKAPKYQSSLGRDELENTTKQLSLFIEGEIQAELNRLLRARTKTFI